MPTAPAAFTGSLAAFFDRHPLAEAADYVASATTGPATRIKVHFRDQFSMADALLARYGQSHPTATVKTSDCPNARSGDTLRLRDTLFYVVNVEPRGQGTTTLILSQEAEHA